MCIKLYKTLNRLKVAFLDFTLYESCHAKDTTKKYMNTHKETETLWILPLNDKTE